MEKIIDCTELNIEFIDELQFIETLLGLSYKHETNRFLISKESFDSKFFDLSTKIAGDILQKCINYQIKVAVYGDFSTGSQALKDLIYELNKGTDINFFFTKEQAIARLEA